MADGLCRTRIAGLFESEIDLAGSPAGTCGTADVVVRLGATMGGEAVGAGLTVADDGTVELTIPKVGRFRATGGRELRVEPAAADVPVQDIRTFLLGTMLGVVLHQRAIVPLHASTVAVEQRAVAIAGVAGAGKSTMAQLLASRGCQLIADDITPVRLDPAGRAHALPLLPQVKLWRDAVERAGGSTHGLAPIRIGMDKYRVPLPPTAAPVPLAAIVLLADGEMDEPDAVQAQGLAAARLLAGQIYRHQLGTALRGAETLFADAASIAASARVVTLTRRKDALRLDALADAVVAAALGG